MRSIPMWVGKDDDTAVPPRVRLRVFERKHGRCHRCERKIRPGESWTCEHIEALINGGRNDEANLGISCSWCLPTKNAADVAQKSKTYRVKSKHRGVRARSRFACSRSSAFKKKLTGEVVPR